MAEEAIEHLNLNLSDPWPEEETTAYYEQSPSALARKAVRERVAAAGPGATWPKHSRKAVEYFIARIARIPQRPHVGGGIHFQLFPSRPRYRPVGVPRPTTWFPHMEWVLAQSYVQTDYYDHGRKWRRAILVPFGTKGVLIDWSLGGAITPLHKDWRDNPPVITPVELIPVEGGYKFFIKTWKSRWDGSTMETWGRVKSPGETRWNGDYDRGIIVEHYRV